MVARRSLALGLALAAAGCATGPVVSVEERWPLPGGEMPPPAPREFRGVWVATVANIDWPSRPALPSAQQQAEMRALLDRAREIGLNAIVLQVRPAADALYASPLEPWSDTLSGTQGLAPDPYYDPLALWVQEAHRRGLELHAWFNPYRARHTTARSAPAATHVAQARPELVRRYGDLLWLDPGDPAAAEHTMRVVADVVTRYDIDAVHIDDYFYPYPVQAPDGAGEVPFPDEATFERYRTGGGLLPRDDWRRLNVDALVERMHEAVHRIRPGVRFGISPFGIGRPELRPPGIEGFSQYDKLFADVERWIDQRWFDYLVPQLYWAIDRAPQAFPVLLDYWQRRVGGARHLWPGLYTSAIGSSARPWKSDELLAQIELMRQRQVDGHIHFSMIALMQDRDGIATRLKEGPYGTPALPPASRWVDAPPPAAPTLSVLRDAVVIRPAAGAPSFLWAVWRRIGGQWQFTSQPAQEPAVALMTSARDPVPEAVVVSGVGRGGHEGPRATIRLRSR